MPDKTEKQEEVKKEEPKPETSEALKLEVKRAVKRALKRQPPPTPAGPADMPITGVDLEDDEAIETIAKLEAENRELKAAPKKSGGIPDWVYIVVGVVAIAGAWLYSQFRGTGKWPWQR